MLFSAVTALELAQIQTTEPITNVTAMSTIVAMTSLIASLFLRFDLRIELKRNPFFKLGATQMDWTGFKASGNVASFLPRFIH